MAGYDYDLFVIGAGSGGVRAARMAAGMGVRVAIAEQHHLGGTCVNVGCIPKKLFVHASHFGADIEDARGYGWRAGTPAFDWQTLISNKDREIARLNGVYARLLRESGAEIIPSRAVVTGPHGIRIDGRDLSTERILVATGGWPSVPDLAGREHVITSNEAFHLDALPRRLLIVGGGYIAVEFAGIFQGLGVATTLVYRGGLFLRGFDQDLRSALAAHMRSAGVELRFNAEVAAVRPAGDAFEVELGTGARLVTDRVMYATGRAPNVEGLGLAEAGVALAWNGAVVVDDDYRSSVPSIYAIGDVTHRLNLTPVAIAEGMAFVRRTYGGQDACVDYDFIPTAVFSQPAIGTVGMTEEAAREHYGEIDIYRSEFTPLKHTLTGRAEKTLMKLVVVRDTDRVVGAHMLGPEAGEIIQGLAIAIRAGATKRMFDSTIGIHPTAAEEFVTMRTPV
ncbi:MAG: glutathione-disulfide reductase [Gammaproteobacteria bacterium]|nr:glutathione-disulfide reductase [Gammaproteobacteria bacterium]